MPFEIVLLVALVTAILILVGLSTLAACVVSSRLSQEEEQAEAEGRRRG